MKVDAWTHILSRADTEHMEAAGQGGAGAGAFILANRALRDLDVRFSVMDGYGDYRQLLTPIPGLHVDGHLAGPALVDLVRRNNEEMAALVGQCPDRFADVEGAVSNASAREAIFVGNARELLSMGG